jgi:hypothetical protein
METKTSLPRFKVSDLESGKVQINRSGADIYPKARDLAKKILTQKQAAVEFRVFVAELMKQFPKQKKNNVYSQARQALISHDPFTIRKINGVSFLVRVK